MGFSLEQLLLVLADLVRVAPIDEYFRFSSLE